MVNKYDPPFRRPLLSEFLIVMAVLVSAHTLLFYSGLPFPHVDLDCFTEPACELARTGRLTSPGSRGIDLSFVDGFYLYPPGYSIVLASWLFLTGVGATSLLAFCHVVHLLFLVTLWCLLRLKYRFGAAATCLAVLSVFPSFDYGRPDLLALLFGALAWLTAARSIVAGAVFLAMSLLVSPSLGLSCCVVVAISLLYPNGRSGMGAAAMLAGLTVFCFILMLAPILQWQHAWAVAWVQFSTHVAIRGPAVNSWPGLASPYEFLFTIVPVALLSLLPAGIVLSARLQKRPQIGARLSVMTAAFIGNVLVMLVMVKAEFLLWMHFIMIGRVGFYAALVDRIQRRGWRRAALACVIGFTLIHFYFRKEDYLPLAFGGVRYEAIQLPADAAVAVDSVYFPHLYRPGQTLNYEVTFGNWVPGFHARSRQSRWFNPAVENRQQQVPDLIVISALGRQRSGPPDPGHYELVRGEVYSSPISLFGHNVGKALARPEAALVYKRRAVPAAATGATALSKEVP